MVQPHNNQSSFDENFLGYVLEVLIKQLDRSFNGLSSSVAATEASMQLSAVLPLGGSAIASSSQLVPCCNISSNSNNISNMSSIVNMGLLNGSTIVVGVMSLRD
jgi:hypothetical protein